jgi:transcription initiation factor TFIID subunit TAF12
LETENYDLERQVFSYQRSIAVVSSKGQAGENWTSVDSVESEGQGAERDGQQSHSYQQQQQRTQQYLNHNSRRYEARGSSPLPPDRTPPGNAYS